MSGQSTKTTQAVPVAFNVITRQALDDMGGCVNCGVPFFIEGETPKCFYIGTYDSHSNPDGTYVKIGTVTDQPEGVGFGTDAPSDAPTWGSDFYVEFEDDGTFHDLWFWNGTEWTSFFPRNDYVVAGGDTLSVPDGQNVGDTASVLAFGPNAKDHATVTGNFYGIVRNPDYSIGYVNGAGVNQILVRPGELAQLRWDGGNWIIQQSFNQLHGDGWHENRDGTVSMKFRDFVEPQSSSVVAQVDLPVQITNPAEAIAHFTDYYDGNPDLTLGQDPAAEGDLAAWNFAHVVDVSTTDKVGFVARRSSNDGVQNLGPVGIDVTIEGAKLDYAALP